jgi:hypothetical protein
MPHIILGILTKQQQEERPYKDGSCIEFRMRDSTNTIRPRFQRRRYRTSKSVVPNNKEIHCNDVSIVEVNLHKDKDIDFPRNKHTIMLFVWTNNGGPLQWVGLVMFLLQIIIPNVLYWLEENDYNGGYYYYYDGNVYYNNGRRSDTEINRPPQQQTERTMPVETPQQQQEQTYEVQGIQFSFSFLLIMGLFVTIWMVCSRDAETGTENINAPRENAAQARPDPNARTEDIPNNRFQMLRNKCQQMKNIIRSYIQTWTGWETGDFRFSFLEGLAVGMLIMKLSFIVDFAIGKIYSCIENAISNRNQDGEDFFSTSTLLYWIPYVHQLLGLCALGFELSRRGFFVGQAAADGRGRTFSRVQQQAKMSKMVKLIRKVPLEMFVSQHEEESEDEGTATQRHDENEHRHSYNLLTVSELKQMLKRRGVSQDEIDSFVDRQNLIDRLKQCRQYSDSCCICFEDYEEGDPVCVLPHCHHELHAECLDKWVYTFANNPVKLQHEPTCPLCKVELKCD